MLVQYAIRAPFMIQMTPSSATGSVENRGFCTQGARRREKAMKANCTAQQVETPAPPEATLSIKQVDTSNLFLSSPPQEVASLSSSSSKSAARQLEISLQLFGPLSAKLNLLSGNSAPELLGHGKKMPPPSKVDSDEVSTGKNLPRPKKVWEGPRRPKRMLPQPPWTADDFTRKAKLILDSILSESQEGRGLVDDVLDSWLGKITRVELTRVIKDLGFRKQPSLALAVFDWMNKQKGRLKPSRHVYSSVIGMLGRAGMISKARDIFDSQPLKNVESVYLYNAMMGAYVKNGNFKRAWKLYEELCQKGVEADEVTFNTLLSGISRADMPLEMAQKLFFKMKLVGIEPGQYTFNTLITNFSKSGNLEGAATILEEMRSANKVPDLCTFNTVISMYGRAGKHEEALQVFNILGAAGLAPDTVTRTNLIQMFSQAGKFEAAIDQFSEMQIAGCIPDVMTYSLLVHVYGKVGLAAEAEHAFKQMQEAGFQPNLVTWSSLVQAYGKQGMLEKANSCFEEMQRCGWRPDAVLFNVMMTAYKQAGLPLQAASLFRKMQSQGILPNAASFNTLIQTFSESGQDADAKALHEQMIGAGFKPDKFSRRVLKKLPARRVKPRDSLDSNKIHSVQILQSSLRA